MSADLVGHNSIWQYLTKGLANNNLSHAYLLVGEKALGKTFFTKRFVQYIFCEGKDKPCLDCLACRQVEAEGGSDLLWLKPEEDKQTIPIEKIRQIKDFINLQALTGGRRVVVIDEVDSMNEAASNALLKSLEEPPQNVIFILIAHNLNKLLATIKSRCSVLNFSRLNTKEITDLLGRSDLTGTDVELIAKVAYGRPALAFELAKDEAKLQDYCNMVENFYDILLGKDWQKGQTIIAGELNEDKSYLNSQSRLASIMRMWQEAVRDALVYRFGASDYVRYQNLENKLKLVQDKITVAKLIKINKLIDSNLKELPYNPNLRLMFESLIAQIINI